MKGKIIFALITVIVLTLALTIGNVCPNPASVGVIGGADGPTAIFIAGPDIPWSAVAVCAVIVACAAMLIVRKRKK